MKRRSSVASRYGRRAVTGVIGAAFVAAMACGTTTPVVPRGAHPIDGAEPIIVEYPPPAAKVEVLGIAPGEPCVWLDGHWDWIGRRWHWLPGSWVIAPKGCFYAGPVTVWYAAPAAGAGAAAHRGDLYYTRPKWYPEPGQPETTRCGKPQACPTRQDSAKDAGVP